MIIVGAGGSKPVRTNSEDRQSPLGKREGEEGRSVIAFALLIMGWEISAWNNQDVGAVLFLSPV